MDRRPPAIPGNCRFKLGRKAEELGLLTKTGNKLHPDGKTATALPDRERQGRMARRVEYGGERFDGPEMIEKIIDRGRRCIEPMGVDGQREAGVGRCQENIKTGQEAGNLSGDDVIMLLRRQRPTGGSSHQECDVRLARRRVAIFIVRIQKPRRIPGPSASE